jgi:carbon storage regulator
MRARGNRARASRSREGMLVLSRRRDESVMVGDLIEVSVLSIKGGKVKLGITAPESVPVFRKEVYVRMAENGHRAKSIEEALGRVTGPW